MNEILPFVAIGGVILLIAGIAVAVVVYEKKRREAFAAIALEMGLEFSPADPFGIPAAYGAFRRFGLGRRRTAKNVMHGELGGTPLKIFDYQYTTGGGKNSHTHHATLVLADTAYSFTYVGIRAEGFFDRMASAVGFSDTEIGVPEFDSAFRIDAEDPEFAKRLLQRALTDFLLQSQETNLKVEFAGRSVMVHRDRRLKPEDAGNLVRFLLELLQKLPSDLPLAQA